MAAGERLVGLLETLANLDAGVHWFCPRQKDDDGGHFFDEDVGDSSSESKQEKAACMEKIQEARGRQDDAMETCILLAFNGPDAEPYQAKLKDCLSKQLTRCDICVREFHRARRRLRNQLESDYSPDDVLLFMQTFDAMNSERITAGLDEMTEALLDMPPEERKINAVGNVGMYAMFEALHCIPFLRHEEVLAKHFDQPFRLAQTKKKVNLPNYAPGMIAFMYSANEERRNWAERNVGKIKRPLFKEEFEYAVKPFLEPAMAKVHVISLDLVYLPKYWRATKLVVDSLDKTVMNEGLRALDTNFFVMALDHFQIDAPHFTDLLASVQKLIQVGAADFWEAVGSATPQNVIEAICKAPGFETLLTTRDEREPLRLEEKMGWVDAIIHSIKPANLVPPLRTLLNQLLHKYQEEGYSNYASRVTWEKGLTALLDSINIINDTVDGGPVYVHLVEAVAKDHINPILQELLGIEKKDEPAISKTELLDLDIVERILAMEVKGLARDRRYIEKNHDLDHEIGVSSLNLWKMTMRAVKPGNAYLPTAILYGIKCLVQLDALPPVDLKKAPKPAPSWNDALSRAQNHVITDFLGRLDHFTPEQLMDLLMDQKASQGFMTLLFSANDEIHQGTLSALKALSGQDNRRDSLFHVTELMFCTTLSAVSESLALIGKARMFGPCEVSLKLCRDILDCLCDTQDGILRKERRWTESDLRALKMFWFRVWSITEMIFEMTEHWSGTGLDKHKMQEFCRDTMDFAEYTFDQYAVLAGIIDSTGAPGDSKSLLNPTNHAFRAVVKWLRLRDDYLITKAVSLTSKMLIRLQDVGIRVGEEAEDYVESIVMDTGSRKIKTKLAAHHKAELQRALERHIGDSLSGIIETSQAKKKQSSLDSFAFAGRAGSESGASTPTSATASKAKGTLDIGKWSKAVEQKKGEPKKPMVNLHKQQQEMKQKQQQDTFLANRRKAQAEDKARREAALAKAKSSGAGTGVLGVGNYGADHSVKGQTVMVDSDDDESESEDDLDNDLFGPSGKPKKQLRPELDLSNAQGLKPEVKNRATRISRQNRSHKDMRARLAPDLGPLHRIILGWDVFHSGEYPPGHNSHEFTAVENSFRDPVTYQNTFEPLLILEAWQGMAKEREESSSKPYEIKVQNRSNVDQFLEISSIIGHQENRDLSLSEGDIILFSKSKKPLTDAEAPHCLARIYKVKRQKAHLEIVYQVMPGGTLAPQLTTQQLIYGVKIQSITPLEREYGALKGLTYYDLCNQITRAKPSPKMNFSERQINSYRDCWNLNEAQSEAVNGALENEGFTLIQGPPGSGKTKTIVAIVGGLLSQTLANNPRGATRISVPTAGANSNAANDSASKKLLVCAPSNAAVDELVIRLKQGVKTKGGQSHAINVVRLGRSDAINTQVRDVTMDELVAKKLGGGNEADEKQRQRNAELFKEHEQVSAQLRELYAQRDAADAGEKMPEKERKTLDDSIVHVRRRKAELGARIDNVKDSERNAGREQELNRKRAQQAVLDQAHVICATLSGSGHDMFQSLNIEFETVVIDEAAQCVEMSSLIPLKYGCIKCIMVGDPKQLPPTVFSKEAAKFQYEQSLFVRMQNNFPDEVHLLDTQYRMHPDISLFPSRSFYDGLLKDGPSMAKLRAQPWHKSALLAPYRFFDVAGQHESAPKGHSLVNRAEIAIAELLYDRLRADFPDYDFTSKIGIITPYKSQLRELKNRFSSKYGQQIFDFIEFNTTDAFQGRESEIIIFSCVRASPAGGIGFLQDIRRMNVGLTRAKSSLWVLGNSDSLMRGQYWKRLVEDARARDCLTTGDVKHMLRQPSSQFPASNNKNMSMLDAGDIKAEPPRPSVKPEGNDNDAATKPRQAEAPTNSKPADPEKMDGIRYRFEDIKKSKNKPAVPSADDDVEMEDADVDHDAKIEADENTGHLSVDFLERESNKSRSNTPNGREGSKPPSMREPSLAPSNDSASRANTPLSGISNGQANGSNGDARPKNPGLAQPPKPFKRKAPASSMFIPKKSKPGAR
ncbi:Helicase SEN1 [Pseudocercospora fuligena]|uniref:Helicase SEN1 n=1 Tax=Pseudocercospora fuligena TaxID=685502 RepID=A0A8H6VMC3_9PEZI|nr:Helicase SEN1 [Pseudocercospora fuligena]